MIDKHKAAFLPIDNRILDLYKGYILNGEPLLNVKASDVYNEIRYYKPTHSFSKAEKAIRIVFILLFIPVLPIIFLTTAIFKGFNQTRESLQAIFDNYFNIILKKNMELQIRRIKKKKYEHAVEEDIPEFFNHCKKNFVKVYLYSYRKLTSEEISKAENLYKFGLISSYKIISKLSDLKPFIELQRISLHNSMLVITHPNETEEASLLGFNIGNGLERNVELWQKGKFSSVNGGGKLEWNRSQTIVGLKRKIECYLKAKSKAFFTNDIVLFIEDDYDEYLNNYIKTNIKSINTRLKEKGVCLIHFPSLQKEVINFPESILQFIRYRIPSLHSLSDMELNETIRTVLQNLSPLDFYRIVLEELELPFFRRPCLLRSVSGSFVETENKFIYTPIEYKSEIDLDTLFHTDINLSNYLTDYGPILFSITESAAKLSTVSYCKKEQREDAGELIKRIDAIKRDRKYGVMVEVIIYMLGVIKDEKPEIINKVKPLLEKKKLLESKVTLSSILIDKHHNIFLPGFNNIEVKLHALPKTVYLFFLRYPQGVRFKELYQHKKELLEIYNKITNRYDNREIEKAIDDLVDMTNPSINQKCARIRESFRKLMNEDTAKYYYIDGRNGEPKKILLPRNLIDIRC